MNKFFNSKIYTDVESAQVLSIAEDGKSCTVVMVKKNSLIEPDFHKGGFMGHTANNEEMFAEGNYTLEAISEPFTLTKRVVKGEELWGHEYNPWGIEIMGWSKREDAEKYLEEHKARLEAEHKEAYVDRTRCGWGVVYYKLTKTGKRFNRWSKFMNGKMEDRCRWYYDYNF